MDTREQMDQVAELAVVQLVVLVAYITLLLKFF
jgi:hypothetical protein